MMSVEDLIRQQQEASQRGQELIEKIRRLTKKFNAMGWWRRFFALLIVERWLPFKFWVRRKTCMTITPSCDPNPWGIEALGDAQTVVVSKWCGFEEKLEMGVGAAGVGVTQPRASA